MGKILVIKGADFSAVAVGKVEPVSGIMISVVANPEGGGTVSGGGRYNEGENIQISASPASGYKFVQWNDGNTNATRTVVVGSTSQTYTAIFAVSGWTDITDDASKWTDVDGVYNNTSGVAVEQSGFRKRVIPRNGAEKIRENSFVATPIGILVFKDASGNIVGSIVTMSSEGLGTTSDHYVIEKPFPEGSTSVEVSFAAHSADRLAGNKFELYY